MPAPAARQRRRRWFRAATGKLRSRLATSHFHAFDRTPVYRQSHRSPCPSPRQADQADGRFRDPRDPRPDESNDDIGPLRHGRCRAIATPRSRAPAPRPPRAVPRPASRPRPADAPEAVCCTELLYDDADPSVDTIQKKRNPAICGASVRAAEGTRTLDLLHGKAQKGGQVQ
jgi:hypothetical protein